MKGSCSIVHSLKYIHIVFCLLFVVLHFREIMSRGSVAKSKLIRGEERTISKSNMIVDLNKLPCPPSCQIILDILQNCFIKHILINTAKVPEVYLTQFWESLQVSRDNKFMTVMIDKKTIKFNVKILRSVLGLPSETTKNHKAFHSLPTFDKLASFLRDLGYDETVSPITSHSTLDRRYIPQPWLTLY